MKPTIIKWEQTCSACPSQWDAWSEKGDYYYIRYRWGVLRVDKGRVGNTIFTETLDPQGLDGVLSERDMVKHVRDVLRFRKF